MNKAVHYITSFTLGLLGLLLARGIYIMYAGTMDVPNSSAVTIIVILVFTLLPAYHFFRIARGKVSYTLITKIAESLELILVFVLLYLTIRTFIVLIQGISLPLPGFIRTPITAFILVGGHLLALVLLGIDYIKSRL